MSTQAAIIQNVKDIVQDTPYTDAEILPIMNDGQRRIAGGMFITYPNGVQLLTSPLPDLATSGALETSIANPYISMPSDFGRKLFFLVSTTNDRRIEIKGSIAELLNMYPSLDNTGAVYFAAVRGTRLYLQGYPSTAEDLIAYYYRKPTDMVSYAAATISFAETGSRIADTAKGFWRFVEGQVIDVTGSTNNNTSFTITAVAPDYSYMTASTAPADEAAGDTFTLQSRPHGIPDHLHENLLANYAAMKIFQRNAEKLELARSHASFFNIALLELESWIETVPEPVIFQSAPNW